LWRLSACVGASLGAVLLIANSPLMVHEALASIRQPLQVESLTVTNGHFRYSKRLAVGADPAVLTIGTVSVSVTGLANRGDATAAIQLQAQGDPMDEGTLKVRRIPLVRPVERCSGSHPELTRVVRLREPNGGSPGKCLRLG